MTVSLQREGGCRCGRVRFRVDSAPLMTMACHCRGCQRMTGSAYSLSALFPEAGFSVTNGETVVGGMHASPDHRFCGWCMSWVFTHPTFPGVVNIRSPLFDDPEGFEPFIETVTAEKLSWVRTPARHAFDGFPAPDAFGPLMRDYQAHNG